MFFCNIVRQIFATDFQSLPAYSKEDAEVKTNHVFVKLLGSHKGEAIDYINVDNVFRELRKKTGIYITRQIRRRTEPSPESPQVQVSRGN